MCNHKNNRMVLVYFQGKPFSITVIQVCAPTTDAEEAELNWLYEEDLQHLLELTAITAKKKRKSVFFVTGNWNVKVGSQEIPRITVKFGLGVQNEAGQRLTEFCQEKILVRAHTLFQQYRRQFYTWTSTNGQYQNQIDYIICS